MTPNTNKQTPRPPVIVVMGHIDHGKSTLLDTIRKENTVAKEAGGITQHTAAYEVSHTDTHGAEKRMTFIDTPGHAAFAAQRSRGAKIADIAVLVVAADDGVKPQTLEALAAIRESAIPFVVAVNKIDTAGAQTEKVLGELAEHEVYVEGRGGDIPFAEISAKDGTGIDTLLEVLLLVAEVSELTTTPTAPAEGFVIEAHSDEKRGRSAMLIIKDGTLTTGKTVASTAATTPVRFMEAHTGERLDTVSASTPVTIVGWNNLPIVGEPFKTFEKKKDAEEYAKAHIIKTNKPAPESPAPITEEKEKDEEETEEHPEQIVPIVIKADVAGTLDALERELEHIAIERVVPKVVLRGVGAVSEADIKALGGDAHALVVGFNVKVESGAVELAERHGIAIGTFRIIYELTEWLEEQLQQRQPKITVEEVSGRASVVRIFSAQGTKHVIGGRVLEGAVAEKTRVRIMRRDTIIGEGRILELQKQKQRVGTVTEKDEFGMKIESKTMIAQGDVLEALKMVTR